LTSFSWLGGAVREKRLTALKTVNPYAFVDERSPEALTNKAVPVLRREKNEKGSL
jgi:hypothetical protein